MITIRPYTQQDFDNYYSLFCDIVNEKIFFSSEIPYPKDSSFDFRAKQLELDMPMMVAYDGETFIGWCDLFTDESQFSPKIGIGLTQQYRDRGIGKELMLAEIEQCKKQNFDNIYLDVFKNNLRAIALYKKLGFVTIPAQETTALHNGEMKTSCLMQYKLK